MQICLLLLCAISPLSCSESHNFSNYTHQYTFVNHGNNITNTPKTLFKDASKAYKNSFKNLDNLLSIKSPTKYTNVKQSNSKSSNVGTNQNVNNNLKCNIDISIGELIDINEDNIWQISKTITNNQCPADNVQTISGREAHIQQKQNTLDNIKHVNNKTQQLSSILISDNLNLSNQLSNKDEKLKYKFKKALLNNNTLSYLFKNKKLNLNDKLLSTEENLQYDFNKTLSTNKFTSNQSMDVQNSIFMNKSLGNPSTQNNSTFDCVPLPKNDPTINTSKFYAPTQAAFDIKNTSVISKKRNRSGSQRKYAFDLNDNVIENLNDNKK